MNAPPEERNGMNAEEPRNAGKEEAMIRPSPQASEPAPSGATPRATTGPEPGFGTADAGLQPSPRAWSSAMDPRRKSVALATVLSLMPGLGQIYVGYYQLGFIYVLIFASLVTILSSGAGALEPLFGLSLGFFILYNLVDAGRRAALYNLALDNAAAGQLPRVELPVNRGSRAGGVVLVGLGVLFLMHTKFDFDMYWLEEWWPAGLIILGVYLFMKDRQSRNRAD